MTEQDLPDKKRKYSSGGITHFLRLGKWCQCPSKRPKLNTEQRDKAKAGYTKTQCDARKVFGFMVALRRAFFKQFSRKKGWRYFAHEMGLTHDQLFHRFNSPYCDVRGVFNFQSFVFSIGWLASPVYTRVKHEAWTITLEWDDLYDRAANRATDRLVIGYFYDSHRDAPQVLEHTGATRADKGITFTIPERKLDKGTILHLYPFFTRDDEDEEDFSRSFYLKTPEGIETEF